MTDFKKMISNPQPHFDTTSITKSEVPKGSEGISSDVKAKMVKIIRKAHKLRQEELENNRNASFSI